MSDGKPTHLERRFDDLGYLVEMSIGTQNDCYAEFRAYRVCLAEGAAWFQDSELPGGHRPDVPKERAQVFVSGSIKFDGCADFQFDEQEGDCNLHTCSKQDLINIGVLLGRLHDMAGEMIPRWQG